MCKRSLGVGGRVRRRSGAVPSGGLTAPLLSPSPSAFPGLAWAARSPDPRASLFCRPFSGVSNFAVLSSLLRYFWHFTFFKARKVEAQNLLSENKTKRKKKRKKRKEMGGRKLKELLSGVKNRLSEQRS